MRHEHQEQDREVRTRLPISLLDRFTAIAIQERRTIAQQFVAAIEVYVEAYEEECGEKLQAAE